MPTLLQRTLFLFLPIAFLMALFPVHHDGLHHFCSRIWQPPDEVWALVDQGRISPDVAAYLVRNGNAIDYATSLWQLLPLALGCLLLAWLGPYSLAAFRALRNRIPFIRKSREIDYDEWIDRQRHAATNDASSHSPQLH